MKKITCYCEETFDADVPDKVDLDKFEDNGWAIYTPGYREEKGKLKPNYIIERKRPDPEIVNRYADQMADEYLHWINVGRKKKKKKPV